MKILLVSATKPEIKSFIELSYIGKSDSVRGLFSDFIKNETNSVDLLITGVGISRSIYFITDALNSINYDLVIQAGICGSFKKEILIGEVVEVTKEIFAQSGAEDDEIFLDLFDLGLENKNEFPFINGWIENNSTNEINLQRIKKVKGVTVETAHGNINTINRTVKKYDPDIESMEGAALFYCCKMKHIPFIEIRSVSNYVEKRNRENWNIPLAIKNLNNLLITVINEIIK